MSEASEVRAEGGRERSTTIDINEYRVGVFEVQESSALRVWHLVMVQRVGECTYGPGENVGEKRRV
jgi:hypothetical protein